MKTSGIPGMDSDKMRIGKTEESPSLPKPCKQIAQAVEGLWRASFGNRRPQATCLKLGRLPLPVVRVRNAKGYICLAPGCFHGKGNASNSASQSQTHPRPSPTVSPVPCAPQDQDQTCGMSLWLFRADTKGPSAPSPFYFCCHFLG